MQIQKETKLFAFKLAEKKEKEAKPAAQWQVRDGVSVAGCTDPTGEFNVRYSQDRGIDNGIYC
jgi:hypothetical protein